MLKRVNIAEIGMKGNTAVTDTVTEMLKKMGTWNPSSLEQVIEASNRLIKQASEDIFNARVNKSNKKYGDMFRNLEGKVVQWYDSGPFHHKCTLYIMSVNIWTREWGETADLVGIAQCIMGRLGDSNSIYKHTVRIRYDSIRSIDSNGFTVFYTNGKESTTYKVLSGKEYANAVKLMKEMATEVMSIPDAVVPRKRYAKPTLKVKLVRKNVNKDLQKNPRQKPEQKR